MAWLLQKVGLGGPAVDAFPYTVNERIGEVGLWDIHACVRKADGEPLCVLIFDKTKNQKHYSLGTNAFNNMRRLRHPAMIHFVDGKEMPDKIFVVTEQIRPLRQVLSSLRDGHPGTIAWGLHQITRAVTFLNTDCSVVHGYLTIDAIVVTKLAGLELLSDTSKKDQMLEFHHGMLMDLYKPPELMSSFWLNLCKSPRTYDPWLLGCLMSELFHSESSFRGESQLKDVTPIPTGLREEYKDLLRPFQRRTMENVLGSRYFKDDYVQSMFFLENIAVKDDFEKDQFFKKLQPLIQALPQEVARYKILPELVKGLDYGTANFRVLSPIVEVGAALSDDEYRRLIAPSVQKWFASPDRQLRRVLLEHLPQLVDRMDQATVTDKIFGCVADGFEDKSPILREMTVKAVLTLAPKMKTQVLETEVLKHFARLQLDQEPGIRTNTTICLGKISEYLSAGTRQKILASAFIRALKDHFPPSRLAGVMSLNVTSALYNVQEIAKKIIPALSHMTIDTDARVREEAFKAMKQFISVLEGHYREMTDEQYVKEATKDLTERTVLDWATGLVGKATSHVTAVAANKVLGTPMPKAAPPPPKYNEDHVKAVSEQVKNETTRVKEEPSKKSAGSEKPLKTQHQASDWGEAFESAGVDHSKQQTAAPQKPQQESVRSTSSSARAPVVIGGDGWDVDDKWSDEDDGEDDGGWGSLYTPGKKEQPVVKPVEKAKPAEKPLVKPVEKPAGPTLGSLQSQPQPTLGSFQPQPQVKPVEKPAGQTLGSFQSQPQPTLGGFQSQPSSGGTLSFNSAFVSTFSAPAPAPAQVPASAWESFSFGSSTASTGTAGTASADGWGDLSFLEGKGTTAPSDATTAKKKSSKKTKK